MKNLTLALKAIILLSVLLTACKREITDCSGGIEFCAFIQAEEYDKAGTIIDQYLEKQKKSLTDEDKLEQLRAWLNCQSCVSKAILLCNSCIYTNPPQSEYKISFKINGRQVEKYLDIVMEQPLSFRTFHD